LSLPWSRWSVVGALGTIAANGLKPLGNHFVETLLGGGLERTGDGVRGSDEGGVNLHG
jgi:hypothetical protein